jgi:hypothetical protein
MVIAERVAGTRSGEGRYVGRVCSAGRERQRTPTVPGRGAQSGRGARGRANRCAGRVRYPGGKGGRGGSQKCGSRRMPCD